MLIKVKQLVVENNGYKRRIFFKNIYINSANIISISDYEGVSSYLLQENQHLEEKHFSLIRVSNGPTTDEIIASGTADSIFSSVQRPTGAKLLND